MPVPTSMTTRLQYQHKSILELIDGLSDEEIRRPMHAGKWSIFENIVHLATYQHNFVARMQQILKGNNPSFTRYVADTDPLFRDDTAKSTREIMHDLLTTRKEMAAEVDTLNEKDIYMTGQHPVYGKLTLLQWLNFFLLHEAHHLFTIYKEALAMRNQN
ncbi:MAG: DinB family protein [Chitinophagales bacterium]